MEKRQKEQEELEEKIKKDRMYMGGRITTNDC